MTKQNIVDFFLQLVDDTGGLYFNTTFTDMVINLAQEEVQKNLIMSGDLYYVKLVTAQTVAGQQDYIWPTDLLKLNKLEIVTSGLVPNQIIQPITPVTLNQISAFSQTLGTPANYVLKQDRFMLYPIPDTTNQTLNLYYSYKIAALTSPSQVPDIPEQYHKVISAYMGRMGKAKDDADPASINLIIGAFESEMLQLAEDRQYQQPRMVIETDTYNSTGF